MGPHSADYHIKMRSRGWAPTPGNRVLLRHIEVCARGHARETRAAGSLVEAPGGGGGGRPGADPASPTLTPTPAPSEATRPSGTASRIRAPPHRDTVHSCSGGFVAAAPADKCNILLIILGNNCGLKDSLAKAETSPEGSQLTA